MLKILEDEASIKRCQQQFLRALRQSADGKVRVKIGHLGESYEGKVSCLGSLGIWFISRKQPGDRYWNAFGVGTPAGDSHVSSACEINFPLKGLDRRVGGAFARDPAGRTFAVHRGKIGGGKKGVGKSLFEGQYRGVWAPVQDGEIESSVVLIGQLGSPRFVRQVSQFVQKVDKIKDYGAGALLQTEMNFDDHLFRQEWIGRKYVREERDLAAECDHGLVTRDLAAALKGWGVKAGNDRSRDLYTVDAEGRVTAVFEVRTDMGLPGLHAAAAKLLLNGLSLPQPPRLLLVVPAMVDAELQSKLAKLKIELLTFDWKDDRAFFPRLKQLLPMT